MPMKSLSLRKPWALSFARSTGGRERRTTSTSTPWYACASPAAAITEGLFFGVVHTLQNHRLFSSDPPGTCQVRVSTLEFVCTHAMSRKREDEALDPV